MNIKFSYLYRDFSNYKKFNEIVFLNPTNKAINEVRSFIEAHLIDGSWFYSSEWQVPDLHFDNWESEDDHFLHEFKSVEETYEESTNNVTIEEFLSIIKEAKNHI
jgi:hypothetical protein